MTAPRSGEEVRTGEEVRAEQVAIAAQAVQQAQATSDQQQAAAGAWLDAGLPANLQVTQPGNEHV